LAGELSHSIKRLFARVPLFEEPLQSNQRPTFTALPALSIMGWLSQGQESRNRRKGTRSSANAALGEKENCPTLTLINNRKRSMKFALLHSLFLTCGFMNSPPNPQSFS
jgi:hypothetical protein